MNENDLKRFARQLFVWAELVIDHGRTPFRRVDLFPRLNTCMGQAQPPLVFWVNRQSLMAGGVILLPDNDLPKQLDMGCAIADALGLLCQIRGVRYDWCQVYIDHQGGEDGYFVRRADVGVIAQEVEAILPEIVGENAQGHKAVRYERLTALLIEAVKELKSEIDELKRA